MKVQCSRNAICRNSLVILSGFALADRQDGPKQLVVHAASGRITALLKTMTAFRSAKRPLEVWAGERSSSRDDYGVAHGNWPEGLLPNCLPA